jgi:hypothetical protein
MHSHRWLSPRAGLVLVLLVALASCAEETTPRDAPAASAPTEPPRVTLLEGPSRTSAKLEVIIPPGGLWKDLHLEAEFDPARGPKPKLYEPRGGAFEVTRWTPDGDDWTPSVAGELRKPEGGYCAGTGTIHLVVSPAGGFGPGRYTFELPFVAEAVQPDVWGPVLARCTTNGSVEYGPSDVLVERVTIGGEWCDFPLRNHEVTPRSGGVRGPGRPDGAGRAGGGG